MVWTKAIMFARTFYRILAQCSANAVIALTLIKRGDVSDLGAGPSSAGMVETEMHSLAETGV
ncbi:hypothetical protein A6R70_24910 [Agrobacterium rubi]|nr:hypothetical protein [Agrobacterium rubi]